MVTKALFNGEERQLRLPLTLTPYIATAPCRAKCQFCSENLRSDRIPSPSSLLRPEAKSYWHNLERVMEQLKNIPLGISLSGLEPTEDPQWLIQLLQKLHAIEGKRREPFTSKVLYSNGMGLYNKDASENIIAALKQFDIDHIELSRHTHKPEKYHKIALGIYAHPIGDNDTFIAVCKRLQKEFPVELVAVLQKDGIASLSDLLEYIQWAQTFGIQKIIFREFPHLPSHYKESKTWHILKEQKVLASYLVEQWMQQFPDTAINREEGYYFSATTLYTDSMKLCFEVSDYERMEERHQSEIVHKLVFHPNEVLTAGWSVSEQILWRPDV